MSAKVISLCDHIAALKCTPDWFRDIYRKPVIYHRDCLINFKLVMDETRFAGGVAWFCRECNKEVFCYEEYIKEIDSFAVFTLFCHTGCNAKWMMRDIDLYVEPLFESKLFKRSGMLEWDLLTWAGAFAKLAYVED